MYPPLIAEQATVHLLIHSVYLKIAARLLAYPGCIRDGMYCCSLLRHTILCRLVTFLLLFSHSAVSSSLQPYGLQDAGSPVLHHLLKLAQIHDCGVSDAI